MFMKIVIDAKPWIVEPSLVPLPWRDAESHLGVRGPKKLIIGIMWSDGVVKPQPPVVRALKEIVDRLKAIPEVDVVHWKPWRHDYALEIMVSPCLSQVNAFTQLRIMLTITTDPSVFS